MEFTLNHSPDVMNLRIDVSVKAGEGRVITFVETKLDGTPLGGDSLSPPMVQYERTFSQVGQLVPSFQHRLVVTARDGDGKEESAAKTWTD